MSLRLLCMTNNLLLCLDQHECYYGFKENNKTSGLEFTEQCFNTEQLCVRVTKDEEGYEYRFQYILMFKSTLLEFEICTEPIWQNSVEC